jgi:alkanesulfonate monooxygenase SsuD/methylene tetrahydromethanopterin reductase-like flavin-dependent oxidoreductase (luciferase family)
MNVKYASAIDDLSDGRLVLGMGTGWQDREHESYGIAFPELSTRYEMLEDALEITTRLFTSDVPVDYDGQHYHLKDALLLPRPSRAGGATMLIGGNGPKKTLPLAARFADEWNAVYLDRDTFRERNALMDELLEQQGRTPDDMKRSLMTRVIFGKDDVRVREQLQSVDSSVEDLKQRGIVVGTASAVIDQIGAWTEAGVQRFMLQWLDQDDLDGLEAMAAQVLPHFHNA